MTTAQHITYTAHISPDENGDITLLVTRDIEAGICGPFSSEMPLNGMDLAQAEAELKRLGYVLAESWQIVKAYDGLRLSATLAR